MSQETLEVLQSQVDELKTEIKESVKNDLGRGYYKMSQSKIISLIGCTITACMTFFGGVLYVDRQQNSMNDKIDNLSKDFREFKSQYKVDVIELKATDINDFSSLSNRLNALEQKQ